MINLPYYQALPGVKSMRPMNTFDLQTLRQHMHQTLVQGGNRQRFEMAQESNQLKKELLQLWYGYCSLFPSFLFFYLSCDNGYNNTLKRKSFCYILVLAEI